MAELTAWLRKTGMPRGAPAGLAIGADGTVAVAAGGGEWTGSGPHELADADSDVRPRWVTWSGATAAACLRAGVRLTTCWDIAAVHRLMHGGWRADRALVLARLNGAPDPPPVNDVPDLFDDVDEAADPARDARSAVDVAARQRAAIGTGVPLQVAFSESAAELLCAELSHDGLPLNLDQAEQLLTAIIGPRPRTASDEIRQRQLRDQQVLRHAPPGTTADLRSLAQVKDLLGRVGVNVPDTRASRLRDVADQHPLVAALLEWRKAERIASTYGYAWLDAAVGADGRLRGDWTGCDGAAGRMTASAGLHNMPAVLRQAVRAEPGHVFVRADLGQIEPRVLAAVSGDEALTAATAADDLYAPVAGALRVQRDTAKVAVLGAMYGQTTGYGAEALRRLRSAYPVAMAYLDDGDRSAQAGRDLRTYGGRLVRMQAGPDDTPARRAARGRYGRNALVQGAAAEFFKMWAATVRSRITGLDSQIVLCLHDELLVHAPERHSAAVATVVGECLTQTAARWAPRSGVRFIADTRVITAWSDAK